MIRTLAQDVLHSSCVHKGAADYHDPATDVESTLNVALSQCGSVAASPTEHSFHITIILTTYIIMLYNITRKLQTSLVSGLHSRSSEVAVGLLILQTDHCSRCNGACVVQATSLL